MAIHLFIAPAGAGKTSYCVDRVRALCRERPLAPVWVCLPNSVQVDAFRRRLAAAGGALGVRSGAFYALYKETLAASGEVLAELAEPLQHRLLRAVIDRAAAAGDLQYYAALQDKPGFVRALHRLIEELKRARVVPERLAQVVRAPGEARLEELAALYGAYQHWLQDEQWADPEGLGWLAVQALERRPDLFARWALVAVDGFDQFNPTQVDFLARLALQVQELTITLTYGPQPGRLAQRRFEQALEHLQTGLGVQAEPLPAMRERPATPLAHLEAGLFEPAASPAEPGKAVAFLEAPNRALEVRAVLRWVKERLLGDGLAGHEVAVLARDPAAYAPFLVETAQEFGIPLCLAGGLPLAGNPAVAALLGLLALARCDRASASVEDGCFPRRQTLEALRSPYFNWRDCTAGGEPLGFTLEEADRLERAAQAGQVLAGLAQWQEALALYREQAPAGEDSEEEAAGPVPAGGVRRAAGRLEKRFERLVMRLTPRLEDTVAGYAAFVEDLIGDAPEPLRNPEDQDGSSLQVLACVQAGPPGLAERDYDALRTFKDALRGLVWAEAALGEGRKVPYERFLDELQGVVAIGHYASAERLPAGAVWAAPISQARGLAFRAVAVLGLGEGEFPRAPAVDPLLRATDRTWLASQGLHIETPLAGAEFTFFYEAITRAREMLLLSRPYLNDDGQPWEPSPFWEEALRLFAGQDKARRKRLVRQVRSTGPLPLEQAASWPEFVAALSHELHAGEAGAAGVAAALYREPAANELWQGALRGAEVLAARLRAQPEGPFEGDCSALGPALGGRYSPQAIWSASRLEAYLGCPFAFFLGYALELPERADAVAGFDPAQLGSMYHAILEGVYRQAPEGDLAGLLAALPAAAEQVLAGAPQRYGFRPSQLWEQEKARIRRDIENTLRAMAEISDGWQPCGLELGFGRTGDALPAQRLAVGDGQSLKLRGVIDRVDRNDRGELRLIDYKTGSEAIAARDLLEGRRAQLALYAGVARQALGLGPVVGGFYWHVRLAKRSSLTLEGLDGGVAAAVACAAGYAWEAISGAAAGSFAPQPREPRCPAYCRGSEFCWRYVGSDQRGRMSYG